MIRKVINVSGIALALALFIALGSAQAGMGNKNQMSLENKIMKKFYLIYEHKKDLEISDAQLKKLKELKIGIKKNTIKYNAEIEIIALDIKALMYEKEIDVAAVDKLVDKKYSLKAEKTKSLVAGCAQLRKILTSKQQDKMQLLFKDMMSEKKMYKNHQKGSMKKGQKCKMCTEKMK